jgi:hypothetical protein
MQYWIWPDARRGLINFIRSNQKEDIHIMFAFANHFEPGNGNVGVEQQSLRVDAWVRKFPDFARRHRDSDGIFPQQTFFFPPHYDTHDHLEKIVKICSAGFGEIEMHLHHDKIEPWPDNFSTLKKKIRDCIDEYSRYGIFCLPNGKKAYGFIHGDWALANSRKGGKYCGVNDELTVLKETGCYADFTFPVCNEAQPKIVNDFFYAESNPFSSKSYNKSAIRAKVGNFKRNGLLLIQGIVGLRWKSRTHLLWPSIEQSNVSTGDFPSKSRIDYWVNKRVHVKGKPDWIFIKLHGHGAPELKRQVLLGQPGEDMLAYFEKKYNDGKKHFLHYVSGREMYNIIRAAEDGQIGNPNNYRDYEIPRYIYLPNKPPGLAKRKD